MNSRLLFFLLLSFLVSLSTCENQCENTRYQNKHRVFICTDISNEPDDQMSLVRFLTYANELDIQGIGVVTSTWLNSSIDVATVHTVVSAYGNVTKNLNANVPTSAPYPSAEKISAIVYPGHPVYGLAALQLNISDAAAAMVKAVDAGSPTKPLWICLWGGANVLAEALNHVSLSRDPDAVAAFVSKLRVYSISDQDNAGAWIRENYPSIFYIVSLHGFSEYTQATWTGISGELLRHFDQGGPDSSLVTNDWLQEHIRIGPLGANFYPNFSFIMEGDTPSFFPLIQNGLGDPQHPEWGNWGGRYILVDSDGRYGVFSNVADFTIGQSGNTYLSAYASIWRWRQAYQYDFAARMSWSASSEFANNNHQPVAIVNGTCGPAVMQIPYTFGSSVVLNASESWDPDGDNLMFNWFHYREVVQRLEGNIDAVSQNVTISNLTSGGSLVRIQPLSNITMHIILSVEDDQEMSLTTYRRIILQPR